MPKPLVYHTGDSINLRALVIDGSDEGRPVLAIGAVEDHVNLDPAQTGGYHVSIPQADLDRADHRDDSYREPTDAEKDLAEMAGEAEGGPVTVTGIDPVTAVVGGPDLTLHVYGTGFTVDTVILFNNGEELTGLVSETEVTTLVKPSLVGAAVPVPVSVVGAVEAFDFTFTEDVAADAARRTQDDNDAQDSVRKLNAEQAKDAEEQAEAERRRGRRR